MAKRGQKKSEDKEELEIPKLTVAHFREITQLIKKYGGRNKVLAYWHAVTLNEDGSIKAVIDHSNHDERTMAKYEALEPLKGIKYLGTGYLTYIPFNWCTEWLEKWEWWVNENKDLPELKGIVATPERLRDLKTSYNKLHVHEK